MKTMRYVCALIACSTLSLNLRPENNQPCTYAHDLTYVSSGHPDEKLLTPITFTGAGVEQFIKKTLNNTYYVKEVLPNDFRHLLQFLYHGKESASKPYAKSVLKLFTNKIKGATYVNAYAFESMLYHFDGMCKEYLSATPLLSFESTKKQINDVLYSSFLTQFDQLKQNPDLFFGNVSEEIIKHLNKEHDANNLVTTYHVQQAAHRFLDTCINKLIWSPNDHTHIWSNVKKIAEKLEHFTDNNILADADELDDLYWSLIHRFCYFLEIASPDLSVSFFEHIKNDLEKNPLLLCDLEEQEEHIVSKGQHLIQAILEGEAAARMRLVA